jgi:hypothetical protein
MSRIINKTAIAVISLVFVGLVLGAGRGPQSPLSTDGIAICYPDAGDYHTGSCLSSAGSEVSLVHAEGNGGERGWMRFNISAIPDNSEIDSVKLVAYVNDCATPEFYITRLHTDPTSQNWAALYDDIAYTENGYYFSRTGDLTMDWHNWSLGYYISSDIQACLSQDWFAVGFHEVDANYVHIDGGQQSNRPYLVVQYRPSSSPPSPFGLTSPANGATGQGISGTMQWEQSSNATGYGIYWGTDNPPLTWRGNVSDPTTQFDYSGLAYNTTYYWRVRAAGPGGFTWSNQVWSFTTTDGTLGDFNLLTPEDNAIDQPLSGDSTIRWEPSEGAGSYDVYFAKEPDALTYYATVTGTHCSYSGLERSTWYHWNVMAYYPGSSGKWAIAEFRFRTIGDAPEGFDLSAPDDGATGQDISGDMSWGSSEDAESYDIYCGTSDPPDIRLGTVEASPFHYSGLVYDTKYYWRVQAIGPGGSTWSNQTWSFTTKWGLPEAFHLLEPEDNEFDVAISDSLTWEVSAGAAYYNLYIGTTPPPPFVMTVSGPSAWYELVSGTHYYWAVEAVNTCGSTWADPGLLLNGRDFPCREFTTAFPSQPGWASKANVPAGPKNKAVRDGGCLACGAGLDAVDVHLLKGNGTCEFYAYNGNDWTTKEPIPAIGRSNRKKVVKKGAALAGSDPTGDIYAVKGNNTLEFWKYDRTNDAWSQKADVPTGATNVREGAGGAAVALNGSDYVYFLKGSGTQEFYRYDVTTNAWMPKADAPLGTSGRAYQNGSSIAYDGGSTIYALKGNHNEFYAYDVGSNSWTTKAPLPLINRDGKKKKANGGAALAYLDGYVYCQKGNNTLESWRYDPGADQWTQIDDMPIGGGRKINGGGALAAGNGKLYAVKGNNTLEFYRYTPATAKAEGRKAKGESQTSSLIPHPSSFVLRASPNPFPTMTTISYSLPKAGNTRLVLYDATGELVSTLITGYLPAGASSFILHPSSLSKGVYLLKLESDGYQAATKLIVK